MKFDPKSPFIQTLIAIGAETIGIPPDLMLFVETSLADVAQLIANAKSDEELIAAEMTAGDTLVTILKQIKLHKG